MEGGRIVQFGTAQEIILNPASDYVAEFVAHMNPLSVLRAAEVMVSGKDGDSSDAMPIEEATQLGQFALATPETPLKEVMRAQIATGNRVLVSDGQLIVGTIGQDDVIRALVER
jgi:glycine betaine/proline transport system ATP-binding protein